MFWLSGSGGSSSETMSALKPTNVAVKGGKLEALEYVRSLFGVPRDRCMAVGDSGNDILMLEGRIISLVRPIVCDLSRLSVRLCLEAGKPIAAHFGFVNVDESFHLHPLPSTCEQMPEVCIEVGNSSSTLQLTCRRE